MAKYILLDHMHSRSTPTPEEAETPPRGRARRPRHGPKWQRLCLHGKDVRARLCPGDGSALTLSLPSANTGTGGQR